MQPGHQAAFMFATRSRLLSAMLWFLGTCAGNSPLFAGELSAGAATSNITPRMGVPLDGTIMQIGPARDVNDELHASCLVLGDGESRLAIVVVDNTMISREVLDQAKAEIEQFTGIPPSRVCISATHTHSTPRAVVGLVDDPHHRDYLDFLASRIADGVRRAVNRMRPAKIGWGSFEEPRFVHNRRWVVDENFRALNVNPFGEKGEIVKMNPGREGLERPAGPVDAEVFVVSIRDAEDRPLALMASYGLHYIGGVPGGTVSADYFGVFARKVEEAMGKGALRAPFVAMMANGTSGDVNANDLSRPRERFAPYERMTLVGEVLATRAVETAEAMTYRDGTEITLGASFRELELKVRKPEAKRLEWARGISEMPEAGKTRLSRGQVYAREARILADYPDRVKVPLQVFRIGDLVMTQIPCEVFAETGLAIKEASPFPGSTFTVELANGFFGYLPPEAQFAWGGYETWPARSSFLEENAETRIREAIEEMMEELKQGRRIAKSP